MNCKNCGLENDEDAIFCKYCGSSFEKDNQNYNQNKKKNKTIKKKKVKKKTKKLINKKYKTKKRKDKKSSPIKNFALVVLIILIIGLIGFIGAAGYYIWNQDSILVPNVIGYTYEEAILELEKNNLTAIEKTKIVEKEEDVGIVLLQSPKENKKRKKNSKIYLTVGVLDNRITMPDLTNQNIDNAITILNSLNLEYKIIEKVNNIKENNLVISQNIKAGKKINNDQIIKLTISKNEQSEQIEQTNEEDNNNEEIDETEE